MKKIFLTILILMFIGAANINAQVVIGERKAPQPFSVLELISNQTKGLRLPQMSETDRNTMQATSQFQAQKTTGAMGLRIYNTDSDCVDTWNGETWIPECATLPCIGPIPLAPIEIRNGLSQDCTTLLTTLSLTAIGGEVTENTIYQWGTGQCGANIINGATGPRISVPYPTVTTTYWVRIYESYNPACKSDCISITITVQ